MAIKSSLDNTKNDGLPPFVSSWRQLYGFVIANLVATIAIFYVLKQYFQ